MSPGSVDLPVDLPVMDLPVVDVLADLAVRALREEAELTPKPGLVDRRGAGAHTDMDLALLLASAEALRPVFEDLARAGARLPVGAALRARVGAIGRSGEARMLRATGGVNTHRGALWALGLLVTGAAAAGTSAAGTSGTRTSVAGTSAAGTSVAGTSVAGTSAARAAGRGRTVRPVLTVGRVPGPVAVAATLARIPDAAAPVRRVPSHGQLAHRRHGAQGAAGEARAAFPHVTRVALPALRAARARGAGEDHARLDALLAVMARLEDTCVLHRGHAAGLAAVRTGAARVLAAGGSASREGAALLLDLDTHLRDRGLSPGGSADLLAAALFVDALPHHLPDRK